VFTDISAYIIGSFDPGLLVISGKLNKEKGFKDADSSIQTLIDEIINDTVTKKELDKVKNQALSSLQFGRVEVMNRVLSLATYAIQGKPDLVNKEDQLIKEVTLQMIQDAAQNVLKVVNSSTLYYKSKLL